MSLQTQNARLEQGTPLSPQQQRLWLLQKDTVGWPYRSWCSISLRGALDAEALKNALESVVSRHKILRTTFTWQAGAMPQPVVHKVRALSFKEVDLTDFDETARHGMSEELLRQAAPQALGAGEGTLLHIVLVKLALRQHRLFLTLPALCADSRSLDILVGEIGRAYERQVNGGREAPDDASARRASCIDLRRWRSPKADETAIDYWRSCAQRTIMANRFPFEWPSSAKGELRPAMTRRVLSADLVTAVSVFAAHHGCDTRAVLLAVWRILLARVVGATGGSLAVAFDGRADQHEIGLFSRFLPFEPLMGKDLVTVLNETEDLLREHARYQDAFSWNQAFGTGDDKVCPFLPAAFDHEHWPEVRHCAGLTLSVEDRYSCSERFTVKLLIVERGERLDAEIHYDASRVPLDDARRLGEEYETLLRSALLEPRGKIATLPLVGPEERQLLHDALNAEAQNLIVDDTCVHERIAAQAAANPDAVALVHREEAMSYGELRSRVVRLAATLRSLGVGAETPVAIYLERCPQVIVSLLAILEAGGFYLPLDPTLPWRRLSFMLTNCQAQVILTSKRLRGAFEHSAIQVLCVDELEDGPTPVESASPPAVHPEQLAYLIYTSGSSGEPKGVAVEHRQLASYVAGIETRLEPPAGCSWAVLSTFTADLGQTAVFSALTRGESLHIVPKEIASMGASIGDYNRRHRIGAMKLCPSHLRVLLESGRGEELLPHHLLLLGGEICTWDLIARVGHTSSCRVINHYGPTEATIGALTHRVMGRDPRCTSVPLGRPLPGRWVHVVDDRLRPVPKWLPGEIYLGGRGLARGYFACPAATAARFLPDPFSDEPGARLYRTGDRARHLQDGRLEFLGRVDQQVKIHGFRVEPGEVEAVLRRHPTVQTAVVLLREPSPGGLQLVAYVTPITGESVRSSRLRTFLREQLPDCMVPARFVTMKSLPLTANGKLDRQALPRLENAEPGQSTARRGSSRLLRPTDGELSQTMLDGLDGHQGFSRKAASGMV